MLDLQWILYTYQKDQPFDSHFAGSNAQRLQLQMHRELQLQMCRDLKQHMCKDVQLEMCTDLQLQMCTDFLLQMFTDFLLQLCTDLQLAQIYNFWQEETCSVSAFYQAFKTLKFIFSLFNPL